MNKKEFKEYATNLLLKKCGCKKLYDLDTSVQKKGLGSCIGSDKTKATCIVDGENKVCYYFVGCRYVDLHAFNNDYDMVIENFRE